MTSTSPAGCAGKDPHLDLTNGRLDCSVFPPRSLGPSVAPVLASSSSSSHPGANPVPAAPYAGQFLTSTLSPAAPFFPHHGPMTDEERRHDGHGNGTSQPPSPPRKYRAILPSSGPAPPPIHPPKEHAHDPPESRTRGTSEPRSHSPDPMVHELRPRKKRNMYTPQQRDVLVHYFETVTDHPTKDQRKHLIKLVGTDDQTVRVWFQNYRAKVQRDVKHGSTGAEGGGAYCAALVGAGYAPVLIPAGAAPAGPNGVEFVVPPGDMGSAPAPVLGYAWIAAPLAPEYPAMLEMGPSSPACQVGSRARAPSSSPFAAIPTMTDSALRMVQLADRPLSFPDGSLPASPVSRHARDKARHVSSVSQSSSTSAHASLAAAIPTPPPLPFLLLSDGDAMPSGGAAAALSKNLGWSRGSPIKRRGGGDAPSSLTKRRGGGDPPSSPTKRTKRDDAAASQAHTLVAQLSALGLAASRADSVPSAVPAPALVLPDATVGTASLSAVVLPDALSAQPGAAGGFPVFSDMVDAALTMDFDMVVPDPVLLPFPTDAAVPLPTDASPLPFHNDTAAHVLAPPPFQPPPDRTRWIKADADSMLDVTAETPFRDAAASPSVLFGSAGAVGYESPDALLGARLEAVTPLGSVPTDAVRDAWADASVPEPLEVDVALERWAEAEPDPVVAGKGADAAVRPVWMAGGTLGLALGTPGGTSDRVDSGARLAM
ncbi:hypothetical protein AMAG_10906 [Allomyces macrogynus ATCC 38327]|uniref:Homeobox domain-containing protein n=1 Tax=Allomyces macrogynus (strain ATCC 38327) TaxID=578462 RepID=A0A0L0SRW6_ALLM3|nr:hypothetical protein AMAG_10906 [Allomyces macrogynus ATCC 38327]|eukprot:KNE65262.1 hypothetical protein AMAG_10906 [Allomyces macrogynus ATCC 38327]